MSEIPQIKYDDDQSAAAYRIVDDVEAGAQATPEIQVDYVLVEFMNEAAYTHYEKFDTLEEAKTAADNENRDPNGYVATVIEHPTGYEKPFRG